MRAPATQQTCELLAWDTEHFGVRIGRVVPRRLDAETIADALRWADGQNVACLYALADAGHAPSARLAAASGFRFVDMRMTLERSLDEPAQPAPEGAPPVRDARAEDAPHLMAIASATHDASRFYADGRFEHAKVDGLFEIWIRRAIEGEIADFAVTADVRGAPAGYLTGRCDPDTGHGIIDLVGVAADARGHGVGAALVAEAVERFRAAGLRSSSVVTQAANVPAQRLYQAGEYRTARAEVWFHRWADEAPPIGAARG